MKKCMALRAEGIVSVSSDFSELPVCTLGTMRYALYAIVLVLVLDPVALYSGSRTRRM
jgi:hypothetical protein